MNTHLSDNRKKDYKKFLRIYKLMGDFTKTFLTFLKQWVENFSKVSNDIPTNKFEGYGSATFLEICIYLLLKLDVSLFKFKQKYIIRKNLISFIVTNLADEFQNILENDNLVEIINQRLGGYGSQIRNSNDALERLHFCLLENIKRSQNNNKIEIWDFDTGHIVLTGIFKTMPLKLGMIKAEEKVVSTFGCCLKHLFENNEDFTQFSLDEIDKRIKDGLTEAKEYFNKQNSKE